MTRAVRIALIAMASCGHPAPPSQPSQPPIAIDAGRPPAPVPLDQDLPRLAQRGSELLQELAKVFEAAGDDCGAAITKLVALKASYGDVIAANAKVVHDGRTKELKAALAPFDAASSAAAKTIVDSKTMATCATDRAFTDAFDELVTPP